MYWEIIAIIFVIQHSVNCSLTYTQGPFVRRTLGLHYDHLYMCIYNEYLISIIENFCAFVYFHMMAVHVVITQEVITSTFIHDFTIKNCEMYIK